MNTLVSTWPRKISSAIALMIASSFTLYLYSGASSGLLQHWSTTQMFACFAGIPTLLATAFLAFTTALGSQSAVAATPKDTAQEFAATPSAAPSLAQVVGVEWLNPLQRRDYPTEWAFDGHKTSCGATLISSVMSSGLT